MTLGPQQEPSSQARLLSLPALHALFFVSGACGLVYEVVWVRQLGNVFGNTVHSAALVTAVFMAGLGAGSYFAGGWVDRKARDAPSAPLRAYGVAELVIAASAAALAFVLPRLAPLAAGLTSYATDAHGWNEPSLRSLALRYVAATILLALPTALMGATFTLLVRYALHAGVAQAAWKVGLLYGANTAGAAAGAYLTDWAIIPSVGLLRTQLAAVLAQAVVGVVAIAASRTPGQNETGVAKEFEPRAPLPRAALAACAALFLSGFAALGMELVWFRGLSASLGSYRAVFSIVLAVILCGIWLGSVAGGWVHERFGHPATLFLASQALFVLFALGLVATFSPPVGLPYDVALEAAARVVALPAFFMGFSMPLAQAVAQEAVAHAGHRAGALYLASTAGSVGGSLVAGFVLAPTLGTQTSFVIMAGVAALAPVPLVLGTHLPRSVLLASAGAAALTVPALLGWLALPPTYLLSRFMPKLPPGERALALQEGVGEVVVVTEQPDGARRLVTNGFPMSGTALRGQRYMRAFAHVPLLMMDDPKSALVICFGVGNTLDAVSMHRSLTHVDLADLSKNVLEHASYFSATNHDVLHDPRIHVNVNDGRQHLQMQPAGTYDLITLEPPPITFAGVSALYSREFYELAKSRLTPDGLMTQWLPAYQTSPREVLPMVRAFLDVFPNATLLSGYGSELVLLGAKGPTLTFDLDRVAKNLAANPRVAADLAHVDAGTLTELVGMFAAGPLALGHATSGTAPLTDDRPTLEYAVPGTERMPASLFDMTGLPAFCPKCFQDGHPDPRVDWLDAYAETLGRLYASEAFLKGERVMIDTRGRASETIARSSYLRSIFGAKVAVRDVAGLKQQVASRPDDAQAHFALAYALATSGHVEEAIGEQRQGLTLNGGDPGAQFNLAVLLFQAGKRDEAEAEAEKTLLLQPGNEGANAMVCQLLGARDPKGLAACAKVAR